MKFVTVREFRSSAGKIWKELAREGEIVVTSNGKPVAILSPTDEAQLEKNLASIRRARAAQLIGEMQAGSLRAGRDSLAPREIQAEIRKVRNRRQ